ncbi:MAG: antitoxin [Anaerolineaceae bacterium]|nr:antitoxin [Anaerolineaceae bacterium]
MHDRIELNPMVCHGKPVIKGTRVMVSTILGALSAGDSMEMILEDYPNITREDITAALAFASELSQFEDIPYQLNQA